MLAIKRYARKRIWKRIYHGCLVRIEKIHPSGSLSGITQQSLMMPDSDPRTDFTISTLRPWKVLIIYRQNHSALLFLFCISNVFSQVRMVRCLILKSLITLNNSSYLPKLQLYFLLLFAITYGESFKWSKILCILFLVVWFNWATAWENLFMPYANNKGADQTAHPRSLISAFVVRCLDSIISILAESKISRLASFWNWAARFESHLVGNPEDRFSRDMAELLFRQSTTKPINVHVLPAKPQISLCVHTVWSKALLYAGRSFGSAIIWAPSKDWSDYGYAGWSESSLGEHFLCMFCCAPGQMSCIICLWWTNFHISLIGGWGQLLYNMSLVIRKPVFGEFWPIQLKPSCLDTEAS